ncbi:MAG: hypothetical protein ACHQUC_10710 [Chlamydiales bacterium]
MQNKDSRQVIQFPVAEVGAKGDYEKTERGGPLRTRTIISYRRQ